MEFCDDRCYGIVNAELAGEAALGWLRRLPASGEPPQSHIVKHKRRRCTYRATAPLRVGPTDVLVKEHRWDPRRSALVNCFCLRRPVRTARVAVCLKEACFRTFEPVGALRSRAQGSESRAWLVLRPVAGVLLNDRFKATDDPAAREWLLRATADETARLHRARFWDGDLRPQNIVTQGQEAGGGARASSLALAFIDIDRAGRRPRWLPVGACLWQALDLRRLVAYLRSDCQADDALVRALLDEYYRARGFGAARRWLWTLTVRWPRKAVTRARRARRKYHGEAPPLRPSRLPVLLRRVFGPRRASPDE